MSTTPEPAVDETPEQEAAPIKVDESTFYGRIAAAMLEAKKVTKSSRNTSQNYNFASAETILDATREALLKRAIVLLPSVTGVEEHEIESNSGTAGTRVVLDMKFTFLGHGDGEKWECSWKGEGQDYGDKAYGKAYTNALKTFIRSAWLLPTEHDDPEGSDPGTRRAKGSDAPPLPVWAQQASKERWAEGWEHLSGLIGEEQAAAFAEQIGGAWGYVPDGAIAIIKAISGFVHAELGPHGLGQAIDSARDSRAAVKAQETAAEAPDAPSPEPTPESAPEEPAGPAPGSIDIDLAPLGNNTAEKLRILKVNGCTCEDPLAQMSETPTFQAECPIKGHGTDIRF